MTQRKFAHCLSQALIASGRTTTYVELPNATHNAMARDPGFRPAVAAYFQSLTSNSTSKVQSQ